MAYQAFSGDNLGAGIFIDAFPTGGKRQLVARAATVPRWRRDGKGLYFVSNFESNLTSVDVLAALDGLQFGQPAVLLGPIITGRGYSYDVSSDDQRFLMLQTSDQHAAQPLTLVQNWTVASRRH